jgi:hypothetical protein
MAVNRNKNLRGFLLFCKEHSDAISKDSESARVYLKEQGKNPDAFAKILVNKIKKRQLEINAANNALEFNNLKSLREKAVQKAKELLDTPGFSFLNFMKRERFALQNKNLENLNEEEIQQILENYLFLKMQGDDSDNENNF